MTHLKQKLIATTAMLAIATTMLSTSTYAWFAISTAPEVATITTHIESTGSFEIALGTDGTTADDEPLATTTTDSGNDTTWGDNVTGVTFTSGLTFPVIASTTANYLFQAPTYDVDGRISAIADITTTVGDYSSGMASVTATINDVTETVASSTLLWLRSNVEVEDATATLGTVTIKNSSGDTVTTSGITPTVAISVEGGSLIPLVTGTAVTLTDATFDANDATEVEVYIYFDGASATNAMMAEEYTITVDSIIFSSATVTAVGAEEDDG